SFNDAAVLDNGVNPASAQALGPSVLYELKKDDFKNLLQKHPQFAANTIKALAGQVRHLVSLVEDLSFRHVIGRVAKILLNHADGTGPARLTQQDMAAIAGSAREVVGRSLKTLEEDGIIRLERHRIVITNKKALEELVESNI
ncbi:MAG: Crp/Fnr family transcriptional regulator, partial [Chloroflexi bacterium]|nr:Crp/Fnr family transcriptional regulator [Chloroflexota bacterium]